MKAKLPIPAWFIFRLGDSEIKILRVTVTAMQGAQASITWLVSPSMPPLKAKCYLTELASTRHKALKRLNQLLTALESRPPLSTSGNAGLTAPQGMTDSSAANPQPKTAATCQ